MSLTNQQRAQLVANAEWLGTWAKLIKYSDVRPFPLKTKAELTTLFSQGHTIAPDCSGFVVLVYHLTGGVKDPTGWNFQGYGNSSTMLAQLKHYENPVDAHPGALVVFGADLPLSGQHVCLVTKHGKNPELCSHGQPGVKFLSLSEEQTAHQGATVFLDVGEL